MTETRSHEEGIHNLRNGSPIGNTQELIILLAWPKLTQARIKDWGPAFLMPIADASAPGPHGRFLAFAPRSSAGYK